VNAAKLIRIGPLKSVLAGVLLAMGVAVLLLALVAAEKPAEAAFPGENGKIAFMSNRGSDYEIYSISPTGSGRQQLTDNSVFDAYPAWSPSGRKVAFVRARMPWPTSGGNEIYKMNADGSNVVRLTDNSVFDTLPAWSPNGGKIAFFSRSNEAGVVGAALFTMLADGTRRTKILDSGGRQPGDLYMGIGAAGDNSNPSWSPDGEKIAFGAYYFDSDGFLQPALYTVGRDGSDLSLLVDNADDPDWSPDGQRIVYTRGTNRIEVLSLDANKQPIGLPTTLGQGHDPVFSPNGNKIAFESGRAIYKANADGSSVPVPLFANGLFRNVLAPDWQPHP
jgi:Tol biopolymer transport system component